jgi:hypothetical protein
VGRSAPAMLKQRWEKGRVWGPQCAAACRGGGARPVATWRHGGRGAGKR